MSPPASMQALVTADTHTAKLDLVPTPTPAANQALIRILSVTLNPTDWKHVELIATPGHIVGCDFTGELLSLPSASDAPYSGLTVGDRVSGYVHGSYTDHGSFAEYLALEPELLLKVPDGISSEVAASAGIGGCTAAQALFDPHRLALRLPDPAAAASNELPPIDPALPPVLIWSGATSVGQWAIQLARAAGYTVITTASPKNHAFLQELGASKVYDYRDASTPESIASAYPNLAHALDCISENGTQSLVVRSLGPEPAQKPARVVVLLKPEKDALALRPKEDVSIIHTLIYSALGHPFTYGKASFDQATVAKDKRNLAPFLSGEGLFFHLFQRGWVRGNKVVLADGGLHGILDGLQRQKAGLSAEKIAYAISV